MKNVPLDSRLVEVLLPSMAQGERDERTQVTRQAQRSQWLAENKSALDAYNRRIESHGTFSDGLRRF